jgi:AraC-like DNA-binding protein
MRRCGLSSDCSHLLCLLSQARVTLHRLASQLRSRQFRLGEDAAFAEGTLGTYRFQGEPPYDLSMSELSSLHMIKLIGIKAGWNLPVSIWHAPDGFGDEVYVSSMPHDCIAYALQGDVECVLGGVPGRSRGADNDHFTLFRTGDQCLYASVSEARFVHLSFDRCLWSTIADELTDGVADGVELLADRVFYTDRQFRKMIDAYVARSLMVDTTAIEMDSRANLIALALLRSHSSLFFSRIIRPMAIAPVRLSRVKEFVENHLSENIGLADLAAVADLSPFHFARAFRHEMGIPPHRYLMERRVEKARQLLVGTTLSLAEIALDCGFASQSHFTTAFRRHTSVTPGIWRQQVRL